MIRPPAAALLTACAIGSILYSPLAVWAMLTLQPEWQWELLGPQIHRVPSELRILTGVVLLLVVFWLWLIDEQDRLYVGLAAAFPAAFIIGYWLEHGSCFF